MRFRSLQTEAAVGLASTKRHSDSLTDVFVPIYILAQELAFIAAKQ